MAKRIAVVLSQTRDGSPNRRELEGAVVAELLMVHGLEVTVVPHLEMLSSGDTGLLCLEGITGDMVMLSWIDSDDAHSQLADYGIPGRAGRTGLTTNANAASPGEAPAGRTIYHIDLRQVGAVTSCCAEIERIRNEAIVQVVDLGLPLDPANDGSSAAARPQPADRPHDTAPSHPPAVNVPADVGDPADDDDEMLDQLIDRLDQWDG